MRRRAITAVCAYKYRRVNFSPEVLEESGKKNNGARHVMRELALEQPCLATVNEHQFGKREVRSQSNLMRFVPAGNFIEETRETMNRTVRFAFAVVGSQQRAILSGQMKTVDRSEKLSSHHLIPVLLGAAIDKLPRK